MKIEVLENRFGFEPEDLFLVGKRVNNEKRNFLFISKLLGKHLEVFPDVCKAAGRLLASLRFPEISAEPMVEYLKRPVSVDKRVKQELENAVSVKEKVLILGFAETATGLGMSVAAAIRGSVYYTTTREELSEVPCLFSFEEEHSHATTHRFYDGLGTNFDEFDEILLVDDEITTGKSMLNLITQISAVSKVKKFGILTVLDWRNEEHRKKYEQMKQEKGISIAVYSVFSGSVTSEAGMIYEDTCEMLSNVKTRAISDFHSSMRVEYETKKGTRRSYYRDGGRFGVTQEQIQELEEECVAVAKEVSHVIGSEKPKKVLILGHGEDIYLPSRVASYIDSMHEVFFRTTTRSPIYVDGEIIKQKHSFLDEEGVQYYFYNKEEAEETYDCILFLEEFPLGVSFGDKVLPLVLWKEDGESEKLVSFL